MEYHSLDYEPNLQDISGVIYSFDEVNDNQFGKFWSQNLSIGST